MTARTEPGVWEGLALPWRVCVEEGWAAYRAGSLPIGAAILSPEGRLLSRGRNRIFESVAPPPLLAGHRLAHAELNALLALEAREDDRVPCALYTTTEPCPLCTGAIRQYGVLEVRYASRDAAGGSVGLLDASPYMRRRGIIVVGPERADLEVVLTAMHVEFWLRERQMTPDWWGFAAWEEATPAGVRLGRALAETGELSRLRERDAPAAEMLDRLATLARRDGAQGRATVPASVARPRRS